MIEPIHIPGALAFLCADCNSVGNSAVRCPACASGVVYPLLNLLERKPIEGATQRERRA
jgi:hypothetical protein